MNALRCCIRIGTAIALTTAVVAVASPGEAAATQVKSICKDVIFIGAAGSGERSTAAQRAADYGMGPEVAHLSDVAATSLATHGLTMSRMSVDYDADSTDEIVPFSGHFNPAKFQISIQNGISTVKSTVATALAACPGSALVLAGYSQGAMAVHDAENAMVSAGAKAPNGSAIGTKIVGTLLLADGDRTANSKAKLFGTAPAAGEGIRPYYNLIHDQDVSYPASTAEICNHHDGVCDTTSWMPLHHSQAFCIHSGYRGGKPGCATSKGFDPALDSAATWVAARVAAGLPSPLASAAVPDLCGHGAGTLVNGSLPGIPAGEGEVKLNVGRTIYGALVPGQSTNAVAVFDCDWGGEGMPEELVFYDSQRNIVGSYDLAALNGSDGDSTAVHASTISHGTVTVDVARVAASDDLCDGCSSQAATLAFRWNAKSKTVALTSKRIITMGPTARALARAWNTHRLAAVDAYLTRTGARTLAKLVTMDPIVLHGKRFYPYALSSWRPITFRGCYPGVGGVAGTFYDLATGASSSPLRTCYFDEKPTEEVDGMTLKIAFTATGWDTWKGYAFQIAG